MGHLFFKIWYMYGSNFKFPAARPYQNHTWITSPPVVNPLTIFKSVTTLSVGVPLLKIKETVYDFSELICSRQSLRSFQIKPFDKIRGVQIEIHTIVWQTQDATLSL